MSRKRYLVTYDISDDRRRTRVFNTLHGFGDRIQYSVFVCDLNDREKVRLIAAVGPEIDHAEDQVLLVDLGPADRDPGRVVGSIGRPYVAPARVLVV